MLARHLLGRSVAAVLEVTLADVDVDRGGAVDDGGNNGKLRNKLDRPRRHNRIPLKNISMRAG
jgi:hypothetical protein